MSSREVILRRIRDALGPDPELPPITRDYAVTSDLDPDAVADRFAEMVDDYRATVHRCEATDLAATLATIITRTHADGPTRVAVPAGAPDAWMVDLHAAEDVEVVRDTGLSTADLDAIDVCVTGSTAAIADTGTIVLDASDDQGRRALTLVPDHHICIVVAAHIVATVPQALTRLDPRRPLTFISGPSATSDIELDRVEGVHGPRTLDVIIVTP